MSAGEREERQLPSRTIAEAIRSQIESGELPPGAQLPSERDLASTYGTARNTAREAVRILADAGLVITDQGKGSFVRPQMSLIRLGNDRYSPRHRDTGLSPFLLECAKQGKTGRFEVLEHRPGTAATRGGRAARRARQNQVGAAPGERLLRRR